MSYLRSYECIQLADHCFAQFDGCCSAVSTLFSSFSSFISSTGVTCSHFSSFIFSTGGSHFQSFFSSAEDTFSSFISSVGLLSSSFSIYLTSSSLLVICSGAADTFFGGSIFLSSYNPPLEKRLPNTFFYFYFCYFIATEICASSCLASPFYGSCLSNYLKSFYLKINVPLLTRSHGFVNKPTLF